MSVIGDSLDALIEHLNNMSEEEADQFRKDYWEFCDKRDREAKEETFRYVYDRLLVHPSVSDATKQQVLRLIEILDTMPYITPTDDGGVSFEYQEVFSGYLYIQLYGTDTAMAYYSDPNCRMRDDAACVLVDDIPGIVHDFYNRAAYWGTDHDEVPNLFATWGDRCLHAEMRQLEGIGEAIDGSVTG